MPSAIYARFNSLARAAGLLFLGSLCLPLLALPGCKGGGSSSQKMFELLSKSDMGIGVTLGQSSSAAEAALGVPVGRREKQAGLMKESYWTPKDPEADDNATPPAPGLEDPQLTLTFVNDQLVQVYSAYHVELPGALIPAQIPMPVSGVKIGARRSDILTALGKPSLAGKQQDEWRFEGEDGKAIGVKALYRHVDSANADLASVLTVSYFTNTQVQRGEQFDKQQKANEALHGK